VADYAVRWETAVEEIEKRLAQNLNYK